MEEIDLSRGQSGILKLAGRARIAPLKAVFSVEIVDGKDESKEDEEKDEVERLTVSPGHRIPCANTIRERGRKSQIQNWISNPPNAEKPGVP
jgi:hypothetical protein